MNHLAKFPWVTCLLSSFALGLLFHADWAARCSLDRAALERGELWRLLTGHWSHWSADHLGWNLLVFVVLGIFLEGTGRRPTFVVCTAGSALAISVAVWLWQPGLTAYRGLSGIDCALVAAVVWGALERARRSGQRALTAALWLTLLAYVCKVAFELTTGETVFVNAENAAFSVVPLAHLVGGVFGVMIAWRRNGAFATSCQRRDAGLFFVRP